jgi:hypothetical protein
MNLKSYFQARFCYWEAKSANSDCENIANARLAIIDKIEGKLQKNITDVPVEKKVDKNNCFSVAAKVFAEVEPPTKKSGEEEKKLNSSMNLYCSFKKLMIEFKS